MTRKVLNRGDVPQPARGGAGRAAVEVALLTALAAAVRIAAILGKGLWYDELQSATHAVQPLIDMLKTVYGYDPHPPLHYLALHLWMLGGTSDFWLKLASVLWSLSALPAVWLAAREMGGRRAALLAGGLFALWPPAVMHAGEARMYAMMMSLAAWSFLLLRWSVSPDREGRWPRLGLLLGLVALIGSQGAGFLFLGPCLLWALGDMRTRGEGWSGGHRGALGVIAAAGVCALPWLVLASGTHLGHLAAPDAAEALRTLGQLVAGGGWFSAPDWLGAAGLGFLAAGLACLQSPSARLAAACFVLAPVAMILAVSYVATPIWHPRAFAMFAPMHCLCFGLGLAALIGAPGRLRMVGAALGAALTAALTVGLAVSDLRLIRETKPYDDYRAAAGWLGERLAPGDAVVVEHKRRFWALAWYLAGPGVFRLAHPDYAMRLPSGALLTATPPEPASGEGGRVYLLMATMECEDDAIAPGEADDRSGDGAQFFGGVCVRPAGG